MYPLSQYVAAGGLISYGANLRDAFRQTGVYAGRIIKGAKPSDLIHGPAQFAHSRNAEVKPSLRSTSSLKLQVEFDNLHRLLGLPRGESRQRPVPD